MQRLIAGELLSGVVQEGRLELAASGAWTSANAALLEPLIDAAPSQAEGARAVFVDVREIAALDTFGAWLIERLIRSCRTDGRTADLIGLPSRYRDLYDEVVNSNEPNEVPARATDALSVFLERTRASAALFWEDAQAFFEMLGTVSVAMVRVALRPRSLRLTAAVHQLDRVGWQAVPIILLITFLIGCIIAQQGFFHFAKFGASDYVVDLVGILVLRELGVLIVAIMVAGRSGSSYTAELGSMKMREEIDALRTMGRDPVEVLILPRILALVIALPILAFLGAMAAIFGGGLVAWLYAGMNPEIFIARLKDAVSLTHFEVGMIKAPFMAFVIGIVACSEGLQVKGSAESLGLHTTTSVVKSIFLVILLDGLFAIFFASIGM